MKTQICLSGQHPKVFVDQDGTDGNACLRHSVSSSINFDALLSLREENFRWGDLVSGNLKRKR